MRQNQYTRRQFLQTSGALTAAVASRRIAGAQSSGLRLLEKELFIPSQNDTGVFPGFVTYIHKSDPVLLHRFGWVDASDTYDNFHEMTSRDNGKTWTAPELKLKSVPVAGGLMRYIENAAYFDADRGKLLTVVSKFFYPDGKFSQHEPRQIEVQFAAPLSPAPPEPLTLDFGLPGGIAVSFCFPIKTRAGQIVVPCFKAQTDGEGKIFLNPKSKSPVYEVRMMLGTEGADGAMQWRIGQPVPMDLDRTSRGFSESMPIELLDGRLALLCRGSNAGMEEVPGVKWLAFSEDGGEHWSAPAPLPCADGAIIESSATGGACFRSAKTGKIYFVGNLCKPGERAQGNWPRSPLYIAELQEEPFVLKQDTITVIDERGPGDSPKTQISNFRYYEDRETGDLVLFATRFGADSEQQWKRADYYRYRVALA